MILIISTCAEKLHELEFARPVGDILKINKIRFFAKHYSRITKKDLQKADRIIICGTSLKDNQFLKDIKKFEWLKEYEKPVLGICSGMQVIGLIFGAKTKKKKEIGFYMENFKKEFLGIKGKTEVYHLHNNYITLPKNFKNFTDSEIPQAIKHKQKEIYGALFHPEVRNKKLVENFIKNNRKDNN